MQTKADFQKLINDTAVNYPAIGPLHQAGDPRILQFLESAASVLSGLSAQLEVAQAEPFEKVRDSTVLADAAIRGIVRKARSGKVRVTLNNKSATSFSVQAGRNVLDSSGNMYRIETPATVAANATGTFDALQIKVDTLVHTVAGSVPFYAIEIPESLDGSYLSGIAASDADGEYTYRERYVNILPDERVFHVEADDRQRIYVRFGQSGIVGLQPVDGQQITLSISRAIGVISPLSGSPFSFELIQNPQESLIELTLNAVLDKGQNPPDMSTLRDITNYPSVYDHNAVYRGEFEFLVRRTYSDTQFLSVWNEQIEELARGASVDHINVLFVACLSAAGTETVLTEADPLTPVAPTLIADDALTATQIGIKNVILGADDSYKVKFFTPVRSKIVMAITVVVSTAYAAGDVQTQIIDKILAEFGVTATASRRGASKPLYQRVYALLKAKIPALSEGNADMQVAITDYAGAYRPELWRYVAADSLTVTVTTANITVASWN
ncbi:MAG: hypothetical protein M0Q44_01410 [Methylobacter sp.]|jgi:hypothetical protein|nr:hypothetical protein [Methylobacter sp.]